VLRAKDILKIIRRFSCDHKSTLPPSTNKCLEKFFTEIDYSYPSLSIEEFQEGSISNYTIINQLSRQLKTLIARLFLLQSELNSHLFDFAVVAKRLSERAFLHLQRSIIVDSVVKKQWINAFEAKRGEEACERLGGVRLLLHGIWAFKVYTPEERTDLVLQEPIRDYDEVECAAEALVLTEWKIVKNVVEQARKAEEARRQASCYASSVLAGVELRQYRYLVLVSKERLSKIQDIEEGDIVYRHINIAVNQQTPSRAARSFGGRTPLKANG
jgi:hypothetical protein